MARPGSPTDPHPKPYVNVTPLIDVLLVLLIIFMVIVPLSPARFLTDVPENPDKTVPLPARDETLVVTIRADRSLMLNRTEMGSVNDLSQLSVTLTNLLEKRLQNHAYSFALRDRVDLPESARIERTVYIKAPRAFPYGEVARVIDGIKGAGARPIGLQIDDLD